MLIMLVMTVVVIIIIIVILGARPPWRCDDDEARPGPGSPRHRHAVTVERAWSRSKSSHFQGIRARHQDDDHDDDGSGDDHHHHHPRCTAPVAV
jgi:hypothetical protein